MTTTNINTKTTTNTSSFNALSVKDATVQPVVGTIDFQAVVQAYVANEGFAYDLEEIFACVCQAMYWMDIRNAQRRGVHDDTLGFIQRNMMNYLNPAEYVENRIQSSLSKVIRRMTRLNMYVSRAGLPRLLTRRFEKDDEGFFDLLDAQAIACDLFVAYETNVGVSMAQKRWNESWF